MKIVEGVYAKINPPCEDSSSKNEWIEEGNKLVCKSCFTILNSELEVPYSLRILKRSKFGVLDKSSTRVKRSQEEYNFSPP